MIVRLKSDTTKNYFPAQKFIYTGTIRWKDQAYSVLVPNFKGLLITFESIKYWNNNHLSLTIFDDYNLETIWVYQGAGPYNKI